MQFYVTIYSKHISFFALLNTNAQKNKKSLQGNAPWQSKLTDKWHADKKGEPLTWVLQNGGLSASMTV